MTNIRQPAVANLFYPGDTHQLHDQVRLYLAQASETEFDPLHPPKAIIAPHAGYIYSGPVAAMAYAHLKPIADTIKRVVLLGPSHRVPLMGFAVPTAEYFETPLGKVKLDRDVIGQLLQQGLVSEFDAAHDMEHSLEVHLPFLQEILPDFSLVPVVAGNAGPDDVKTLLDAVWDDEQTFIVISSDLSHYLDYDTARQTDLATCKTIEQLRYQDLTSNRACGFVPVSGLLAKAKAMGLSIETVDYRNSGDTAGSKDAVVGYGAYVLKQ